jgi:hypothetical protein
MNAELCPKEFYIDESLTNTHVLGVYLDILSSEDDNPKGLRQSAVFRWQSHLVTLALASEDVCYNSVTKIHLFFRSVGFKKFLGPFVCNAHWSGLGIHQEEPLLHSMYKYFRQATFVRSQFHIEQEWEPSI